MIRLTDDQWERIRDHFPEENIADGRPGRKATLEMMLSKAGPGIRFNEHMEADGETVFHPTRRAAHSGAL
jgi:hypothetical protein